MEGWIKLHRQIMDHPDYFSEPFSRTLAWVDLLLVANHKAANLRIRGNKVTLGRGETALSQESLAVRWKWSRGKVKRYLDELEAAGQIAVSKSHIINTIRILNYDAYQTGGTTDAPAIGRLPEPQQRQQAEPQNILQADAIKKEESKTVMNSLRGGTEKYEERLPLREAAEKLAGQAIWLEQVALQRGLGSGAEARRWLERFFGELSIRGQSSVTEAESRSHFVNWLRIQLEKNKRITPKTSSHGTPKRITGSDFD